MNIEKIQKAWPENAARDRNCRSGRGRIVVRLPYRDGMGDPLELTFSHSEEGVTIDDSGSIAGLLFSLGQHTQGTPAVKLLTDLVRTHGLEIDYDEGLIKANVENGLLFETFIELAKVLLTVHTAAPHITVHARRSASTGGPRLKSKIRNEYRKWQILEYVESDSLVDGEVKRGWPVDFHWIVGSNGSSRHVDVVTTDLNVVEPFERAQRVAAFSVDTQGRHSGQGLRVIIESKPGMSCVEAEAF